MIAYGRDVIKACVAVQNVSRLRKMENDQIRPLRVLRAPVESDTVWAVWGKIRTEMTERNTIVLFVRAQGVRTLWQEKVDQLCYRRGEACVPVFVMSFEGGR